MTGKVWTVFAVVVALSAIASGILAADVGSAAADAAKALTLITFIAVAIERTLEGMWTVVGQAQKFGGWWPLSTVMTNFNAIETETNNLLNVVIGQVKTGLENAKKAAAAGSEQLATIEGKLKELDDAGAKLKTQLAAATTNLAPGSSRLSLVTQVASSAVDKLNDAVDAGGPAVKGLQTAVQKSGDAIALATTIVGSFDDNPARRLASIMLGVSAGMIIAGLLHLNLATAVLAEGTAPWMKSFWGVLATGIIVGLGSGPTHEVIKSLQAFKESRKPAAAAQLPQAPLSAVKPLRAGRMRPDVAGGGAALETGLRAEMTRIRSTS